MNRSVVAMHGPYLSIAGVCLIATLLFVPLLAQRSAAQTTAPGERFSRISGIQVRGNQRIEAETVRSYMVVAPGDAFDPRRIDRSLKALFATGLFADVSIRRAASELVVNVVENPIINQRVFEGNRRLSEEVLAAEVQLRPRFVYTRSRIQNDVQRIQQLYRSSGRFAATVEPKVIQLPENRVDLVFEINEGPLTKIRRISFIGNKHFKDSTLRTKITTKESRYYRFFTASDRYDPDRLTLDRDQLRRFYLSRGYADFRILSAIAELSRDRLDFFITFTIDEGELYRFGQVAVDSNIEKLDPALLRHLLKAQPGAIYNAEEIEDTILALTFEAGRLGYAFVDVRPKLQRDRETRTIGVTLEVNEGPRVYVERIDISGNARTLDEVIRREFRLAEGDAFNTAKLHRSVRQIRGLGFFEKVKVSEEKGSKDDRNKIKVEIEESTTGELSFGAGFSTTESLIGDVAIRERNLVGKGQDLRLAFSLSSRRQQIDLSFTEPYFLDRRLAAGFDIFRRRRDLQDESSFDESNLGLRLRSSFPITEKLRQSLNYTLREEGIEGVGASASRLIHDQEGSRVTSSLGHDLTYDLRDDRLSPTRGYLLKFGQSLAGFGGQVRYLQNTLDYSYFYPLRKELIGSLSFRQGYIFGLGQDVGIADRFFIGGASFRGFAPSGIGPRDLATGDALGGNLFYVGTAELSFPIGLPNELGILGRVFTEVGSLASIDESGLGFVDKGSPRLAVGPGISWRSPLGPLRLDFGYAIVKEDFDKTESIRFGFGTRF